MKLIHMRNSNHDITRSIKICQRLNAWWLTQQPDNTLTSYYETQDWMQSADIYIDDVDYTYEINILSPLFKCGKLLQFPSYNYVCVKVYINDHYNCILINNTKNVFELFDSSGSYHLTKKVLSVYKKIFHYYPLVIVQYENLQKHKFDCYCQTWIYVWFYYRICLHYSHTQFKRHFQTIPEEDLLDFIIQFHKQNIT